MSYKTSLVAAALAVAVPMAPAFAASIAVTEYNPAVFSIVEGTIASTGEDFETLGANLGEGEVGSNFSTAVGTFNTLGGTGTGGTVSNLPGNTGTELALRDGNTYGRYNTQPLDGDWYLDSNDTYGIDWDVSTGSTFNTVIFTLVDGSDTGAFLRITSEGDTFEQRVGGKLSNGNASIVVVSFDTLVSDAVIEIGNYTSDGTTLRTNDGFAIDGLRVGTDNRLIQEPPAPVPLPASGLLLIGALAATGWRARKRQG